MPFYSWNDSMIPVRDRRHERPRIFRGVPSVAASFRPASQEFPVFVELLVLLYAFEPRSLQFRNFDKIEQPVSVAGVNPALFGELVSASLPCDARLQSAFHRIACQIVRAIVQAQAQKSLGLAQPNPRER